MIRAGELGRVFHLQSEFNYFVPDYLSPPYSTILARLQRVFKFDVDEMMGTWRVNNPKVRGGIFQDHGPHYADLYRYLLGDDIAELAAFTQKVAPTRAYEDQAACLFRFEGGATASLQISLATWPGRAFRETGVIHGEKASVRFGLDSWWFTMPYFLTRLHRNRLAKFNIWNYPFNLWRPVFTWTMGERWMGDRQMRGLIASVRGERHPLAEQLATGIDGRKAMAVVIAAYQSSTRSEMLPPGRADDTVLDTYCGEGK